MLLPLSDILVYLPSAPTHNASQTLPGVLQPQRALDYTVSFGISQLSKVQPSKSHFPQGQVFRQYEMLY